MRGAIILSFYTPKEAYPILKQNILKKLSQSLTQKFALGIFAGILISIGAFTYILALGLISPLNLGLAKVIASLIFAIGLSSIIIGGGDLLTGNFLLVVPYLEKEVKLMALLKNWGLVFFLNLIGALLFALFVICLGNLGDSGIASFESIGLMKATTSLNMLFFRAIGCNFLVCLGIWLATTSQDIVGKFFPSIFCVFTFVFAGFEHSIANMFTLPVAFFFSSKITLSGVIGNILIVTLGNAFGAIIFSLLIHFGFSEKHDA